MKSAFMLLLFLSATLLFSHELESFAQAKKRMQYVYKYHPEAFFSGCAYNYKKTDEIDYGSCGYTPAQSENGAGHIVWEAVMTPERYGGELACWREGDKECVDSDGKPFKGKRCCRKVSKAFRIMQADMMNLVPVIDTLGSARNGFSFGSDAPKTGQYGTVAFEVDPTKRQLHVRPEIRGDIARIYLYMSDTYNIRLSDGESTQMEQWNREDPEDAWEKKRKKVIEKYQNLKIKHKCSSSS